MMSDELRITRKVQQLGSSTLAVTLPAQWARDHDVEKGDSIVIQRDESSGSLLVVPDRVLDDSETTIYTGGLDADAIRQAIVAQYVLGRRLIHITSDGPLDPAHRDAVLEAERHLMGVGIVEEDPGSVILRCSVAVDDFELPELLGRIGQTEAPMRTDAVAAFVEGDEEHAQRVEMRHDQVRKLYALLLRLLFATYRNPDLNRAVGLDTGFPVIGYRSVAQDIVLMADAAVDVADRADTALSDPTAAHIEALADAIDEAAVAARTAVVEPKYVDVATARAALTRARERVDAANNHLEADRPDPLLATQRVVCTLDGTVRQVRDTLDVATRLTFRDGARDPTDDA